LIISLTISIFSTLDTYYLEESNSWPKPEKSLMLMFMLYHKQKSMLEIHLVMQLSWLRGWMKIGNKSENIREIKQNLNVFS